MAPIVLSGASKYIRFSEDSIFNIDVKGIVNDNNYFSIIDGQHRIEGIKEAGRLEDFTLPVIITLDTTLEQDAEIFVAINENQLPVSKSLIYDLFGLSNKRTLEKTCHTIIKSLNMDKESKISHKIKVLGYYDEISREATVSQTTMVDFLIKLITNNPKRDNDNLEKKQSLELLDKDRFIFRKFFIRGQDEVIYKILKNYFNAWTDVLELVFRGADYNLPFLENSIVYMAGFYLLRAIYLRGILDGKASENYYREILLKISDSYVAKYANKFNEPGFGYSSSESGAKALFKDLVEAAIESDVFNISFVKKYAKALTLKNWFDEYILEFAPEPDLSDTRIEVEDKKEVTSVVAIISGPRANTSEEVQDPDHPDTAKAFNNIARTYDILGEYNNALEWYFKALSVYENFLDPNDPDYSYQDMASAYSNIARTYDKLGEYNNALEWYEGALAVCIRVLGPDHPDTATAYNNIASVYSSLGEYTKALVLYEGTLAVCIRVQGPDHLDTATACNNIASVYSSIGKYIKALECYGTSLVIRERIQGPDHPDTATAYDNIASLYSSIGEYTKALECYVKALTIRERVLGPDHPDTATTYNNIAVTYVKQGKYDKAPEC